MHNLNIVLIGMPSSGKSTVGELLAASLEMNFLDTDRLIYEFAKKELKDIVLEDGLDCFLDMQQKVVLSIDVKGHIIATGGGVVYGKESMKHLKKNGIVIYLMTDFEEIEDRVAAGRRFARREGQSLYDMFSERKSLYEKYCDIEVDCTGKKPLDIIKIINEKLEKFKGEI